MKTTRSLVSQVDGLESSSIELLQQLIRFPSITGSEKEIQEFLSNYLTKEGFEIDRWCPTRNDLSTHSSFSDDGLPLGDRPVLVAKWSGRNKDGSSLILNGHVDVVPPGDKSRWKYGAWNGTLRDGRIFGRGSCDMKAGLVSGITALRALRLSGFEPEGNIYLQSVIGEETGGAGTLATIVRGYRANAAIILEPTRLAICPAGAGAASFRLTITGRSAHAAMRQEGISAIEKFYILQDALNTLEKKRHNDFSHPLYRSSELVAPISIGKITAGNWPSTVPEQLISEGRFGVLPGEKIREARRAMEAAVRDAAESDDWLREHLPQIEWFEGQFEPGDTPVDAAIVQTLSAAHAKILGSQPDVHGVPYGSDLRFFTNDAGMQAVLYGPGDVRLAHSLDESVPLAEVMQAAKVLAETIVRWCGNGIEKEER
jgi:acetylornithine deacetylase